MTLVAKSSKLCALNKLFNKDKIQLAFAPSSLILANYILPINEGVSYQGKVLAYCIHIDRKTLGTRDISIEEWESLVNAHPEMELLSSIKGKSNTGNSIEIGGGGNAVWFIAERKIHFTYYEGRISTSETDHSVQHHMHFLAYYLNAEVRGDEGELYKMPDFIKQQITENELPKTLGQKADALAIKITKQYDKLWVKVLFFTLAFCIFYMTR